MKLICFSSMQYLSYSLFCNVCFFIPFCFRAVLFSPFCICLAFHSFLVQSKLFNGNPLQKYCQNNRSNYGFNPIGLLMSIDEKKNNSRLMRAKNSLWDDSNRGFLQLDFFLSESVLQRYEVLPTEILCSIACLSQCENVQHLKVKWNWEQLQKV